MTAKEKAKQLVDKYLSMKLYCDDAKECAIIAVDEIIVTYKSLGYKYTIPLGWDVLLFFQQVRQEIKNIEI
jgi:hypothetical protein